MKTYLSKSGLVLGLLATVLGGCAGAEEGSEQAEETKSAITSQGFMVNGCAGTGIFNITSNNLIDFVALDQSSFSNVYAQLYALNQNNREQLIANTQNTSALSSAFTSMLDQVSNYTSAWQQATMLAQQNQASYGSQYATNLNAANTVATSAKTATHLAAGQNTVWSANQGSGYNNTWTSNLANTWQNQANQASGFAVMNSAALNAIYSDAQQFANAGQWGNAVNGATHATNALRNAGSLNAARNAMTSSAMNGAVSSGIQNNGAFGLTGGISAAAPLGWGWGGFGYAPVISNMSAFNNSAVFGNQFGSAINGNLASQNNAAWANMIDNTLSNVWSNANQASYSNVGSNAINSRRSNALNNYANANQASAQSNLANNASTQNAYNNANYQTATNGWSENNVVADQLTRVGSLLSRNTALGTQSAQAGSLNQANSLSQQATGSNAVNQATSQNIAQQYQAMTNLQQYASNNMALVVNVTANSNSAVLNVFTGNSTNRVAANNSFVQPFAACGAIAAPVAAAAILPPAAPDAAIESQVAEPLGDHVAKPE